jgi:glycosyltransferase involved in cell wall biosynthesis
MKTIVDNILVSVVIPVYNAEKYIYECLNSIIEQTHKNLEIIIIDDGSNDRTGLIVDDFSEKDTRINVIHKQNEGVSITKNRGIKIANGKYITFIDADDFIRKDYIENLVNDMSKYNTLIATTTKMSPIDEDNYESVEICNQYVALERLFYGTLEKSDNGVQMYDRKLIIVNEILFDSNKKIGEDFDFFAQAIMHCNKVAIDYRKMYFYRPNPTSVMNQQINKGLMDSVTNFNNVGKKFIKIYPQLKRAVDAKKFNDSVSLSIRTFDSRHNWGKEYIELGSNIKNLKWQILFDSKVRNKVRVAASIYCLLGNHLGTSILRNINK